jgi:hypothetical protein
MGKPHFNLAKVEGAAGADEQPEGREIVIRADRVVLGSSLRRKLRVVCFENPASVAARRPSAKS